MIARLRMHDLKGGFWWRAVRARRLDNFCLSCMWKVDQLYVLTHIASGERVGGLMLKEQAVCLAKALNALPVDWRFKVLRGPRWEKAKKLAVPIIRRFL